MKKRTNWGRFPKVMASALYFNRKRKRSGEPEQVAPTVTGTLSFTPAVTTSPYSFDGSNIISGATSYGYNGTLPSWLEFDTNTCEFTGTPSDDTDVTGISIYGVNSAGDSDNSNTDDISVTDYNGSCSLYADKTVRATCDNETEALLGTNNFIAEVEFYPKFLVSGEFQIFFHFWSTVQYVSPRFKRTTVGSYEFYILAKDSGGTARSSVVSYFYPNESTLIKLILQKSGTTFFAKVYENNVLKRNISLTSVPNESYANIRPIFDGTQGSKGTIKSISLSFGTTDLSWDMNSYSTTREPSVEEPLDSGYDLIYSNVTKSDWSSCVNTVPMVFDIETTAASEEIQLPLVTGYAYAAYVDWGDGTSLRAITAWDDTDKNHTYTTAGTYTVKIYGKMQAFSFENDNTSVSNIKNIQQIGENEFTLLDFSGATLSYINTGTYSVYGADVSNLFKNVTCNCIDALDVSDTSDSVGMFSGSTINSPNTTEQALIEGGTAWLNSSPCPPLHSASLDFSDANNSQYIGIV